MNTKSRVNHLSGMLVIILTIGVVSSAATKPLDQVLAPCLEDQTYAVLHVDVTKLNAEAWINRLLDLFKDEPGTPPSQAEIQTVQRQLTDCIDTLVRYEAHDVFLVFSMYDFPYFFVALPCGADCEQVRQYVQTTGQAWRVGEIETHVSDGLVLAGLTRTIERLRTVTPVASEALAAGALACPNTTVQAVVFPSPDQRRVLMEMLPQIAPASGKGRWSSLGTDLKWLALGFEGPPAMALQVTVLASDVQGAGRVLACIRGVYTRLAQNPGVRQVVPKIDETFNQLTPRQQGDRLVLMLDAAALNSIINDVLAPLTQRSRSKAFRIVCKNNLAQIGVGLLMYANNHDDRFPPDLAALRQVDSMTKQTLQCPLAQTSDSYVYRGASISVADIPTLIMVYERANYHGNGRNVLFLDSHTEWVAEKRFQDFIRQDNEYRRKKGLPELPVE